MGFELRQRESIRKGLRRLARRELRVASEHLSAPAPSDAAIHQARKSIKKVRTILQLVEADNGGNVAKDKRRLSAMNATLSRLRDADAMVEILLKLRKRNPHVLSEHTFARLRRRLEAHKRDVTAAANRDEALRDVGETLQKVLKTSKRWRSRHRSFRALAIGMQRTHERGRRAMARAIRRQWAIDFHTWRKQIKKLMYELRMIADSDATIRNDIRALHRAETWLGDDHNVDVLCRHLRGESVLAADDLRRLWHDGARYQRALRRKALVVAKEIYATESSDFVQRLKRLWKAWNRTDPARTGARTAAA